MTGGDADVTGTAQYVYSSLFKSLCDRDKHLNYYYGL